MGTFFNSVAVLGPSVSIRLGFLTLSYPTTDLFCVMTHL